MGRARVVLHSSKYWNLEHQITSNVLVLMRTNEAIDIMDDFIHETGDVVTLMRENQDVRGLVVNMRAARSRNDSDYESATAELREVTYCGFKRVALVLASAAVALQQSRLGGNNNGIPLLMTSDMESALTFASVRSPILPPRVDSEPMEARLSQLRASKHHAGLAPGLQDLMRSVAADKR